MSVDNTCDKYLILFFSSSFIHFLVQSACVYISWGETICIESGVVIVVVAAISFVILIALHLLLLFCFFFVAIVDVSFLVVGKACL